MFSSVQEKCDKNEIKTFTHQNHEYHDLYSKIKINVTFINNFL